MRILKLTLFVVLVISMTSCSVYRMNIRQGNIVEQEDVDQIRKGMNEAQIRFLLGRPLVNDTFDNNTWYYINTLKSGETSEVTQKELMINFIDGKVTTLSGDFEIPTEFSQAAAE